MIPIAKAESLRNADIDDLGKSRIAAIRLRTPVDTNNRCATGREAMRKVASRLTIGIGHRSAVSVILPIEKPFRHHIASLASSCKGYVDRIP